MSLKPTDIKSLDSVASRLYFCLSCENEHYRPSSKFCISCSDFRTLSLSRVRKTPGWRKSCIGCGSHIPQHLGGIRKCEECRELAEIRHNRGLDCSEAVIKACVPVASNDNETHKTCRSCLSYLKVSYFSRVTKNTDGLYHNCRGCASALKGDRTSEYAKQREDRFSNKSDEDKQSDIRKRRMRLINKWRKQYLAETKRINTYIASWRNGIDKPWLRLGLPSSDRYRIRYAHDEEFMLKQRTRTHLKRKGFFGDALKSIRPALLGQSGCVAKGNIESRLGYSMAELKLHIESLFTPGMNWDVFRGGSIHIDHIRPLNTFNLEDEGEAVKAWSLVNLRPLWARDNCSRPKDGSDVHWPV